VSRGYAMTSRRTSAVVAATALVSVGLLIPQSAQARPEPLSRATVPQSARAPEAATQHAAASVKLLGGPGVWTKFSSGTVSGFAQIALLRTANGQLHAAWVKQTGVNKLSVASTTFSLTGSLVHNGIAIKNWYSLEQTLALVPNGKNIRLIFNGGQDNNNSNKFSLGARYTATSTNGLSWSLVSGSLSSHTVLNQPLAATTELDGTPVSAEGLNSTIFYHVGVDPSIPAAAPDHLLTHGSAFSLANNTLVRDKDGSIYIGWYEGSNTAAGYWVKKILPAGGTPMLAPHSKDVSLPDNEPFGPVALAARVGGGVYLAYCQPSKSEQCAQIDLWKVGSKTVRVVPGSASGAPVHVTLSAGAKGRLVVAWFDKVKSVIRVVRTNTHATAWGVIRTVAPPVKANNIAFFDGLFSESSSGRIDLVANVQQFSNGAPVALYHTQVLEGLKVTASPTKVSHLHSTTVTFKVTDAGEAVAGATVSFDGHKAHTNSKGIAKIKVAKGHSKGGKTATASKTGYYKATCSVKIT
jgi:hypothetical protein